MRALLVLLIVLGFNGCLGTGPYVPGEKGADWTLEETLIVKAKLWSTMDEDGGWGNMWQVHQDHPSVNGFTGEDIPNEAKFVRLGFHDCLKYADGSGGCDGCLNWEGMGWRQRENAQNTFSLPDVGLTNNNGMRATVELLEAIYTRPDFPQARAPYLTTSLKDSGKSRADLWAFAALVAVEYSMESNNMVCNGAMANIGNPDLHQCHHNKVMGIPGCEVEMKPLKFKTGRRDCAGPEVDTALTYKTSKHEHHPNAVGGGKDTADFFQKSFDFTGREMVAIMGAHTLGHFHYSMSLFRYVWTSMGDHLFNNHYYKNVVAEDRVAFNERTCHPMLMANGSVPKTRWINHVHKNTIHGGPVHWIHENYRCPNCADYKTKYAEVAPLDESKTPFDRWQAWVSVEADEYERCCTDLEPGQECKPECERWRFLIGRDEMAIPAEMGLYYQFDVDDVGLPSGCPGYNHFTFENIKGGPDALPPFREHGLGHAFPQCPLNDMSYPEGSNDPLHAVFEEYAEDQAKWIDEFIPTYEKMLANGYNSGDLVDGPDVNGVSANVVCSPRSRSARSATEHNQIYGTDIKAATYYYNCWVNEFPQDLSGYDQFTMENMWLPMNRPEKIAMVLASDNFGHAIITMPNPEDLHQKWVQLEDGVILNVGNRMPLSAGGGRTWKLNSQIGDKDGYIEMTAKEGWAISCSIQHVDGDWSPVDGDRCSVQEATFDPRNRFIIRGLPDGYPEDLSSYNQFTLENMWLPLRRPEVTPMVLESDNLGFVFTTLPDLENPNQKWVQLEDGIILNVGNRLPLSAETNRRDETCKTWNLNVEFSYSNHRVLDGYIEMTTKPGWALSCPIVPDGEGGWSPRDGGKCYTQDVTGPTGPDARNRFSVKMSENNEATTEAGIEETTTTAIPLSNVPCVDKRNSRFCNRNRCTNNWWFPKTQCIKSCSETEGAMDFCEGNETLPCKDFDENVDCEAVKRDGKCDDATAKNGKMKQIWNLRCFKTCGNC